VNWYLIGCLVVIGVLLLAAIFVQWGSAEIEKDEHEEGGF
jgi:hypothetical protein